MNATIDPKGFLKHLFEVAVAAAQPEVIVPRHLPNPPAGRTIVIGAGKASAQMARAFEKAWDGPVEGLIVTQYGAAVPCEQVEIVEANHPVPDEAGLGAAARLLELAASAGPDDLVVALISGGGSALLPAPAAGLTLADEQAINTSLLNCGAPISAMNTVRKVFSRIKGGRLAAMAHPARVVSLVLSDVPGDDPAMVASGPTVADAAGIEAARDIVARYSIELPEAARAILADPQDPPPRPNDPRLANATHEVIASAALSLDAAAAEAGKAGCAVTVLSDAIEGEAREVGVDQARLIWESARRRPLEMPHLILSGGETTVTLDAPGKGGRNGEYLLSLAIGIAGLDDVHALAADTDGRDGSEDNAGALADGTTVERLRVAGNDAGRLLAAHQSWTAFDLAGDLLVTGPTGTNVNDFRALLIL